MLSPTSLIVYGEGAFVVGGCVRFVSLGYDGLFWVLGFRVPWSQQFICVECKPWVRRSLVMTYSRLTMTSHALTQSRQISKLAKYH